MNKGYYMPLKNDLKYITKLETQKGFTLIELSIVMVIIGLIIGGILVGQDLIHGAQVRSLISQIEKYNTGVNAFTLKYNAIPGDFNQAANYITNAVNGDGNGLISTGTPSAAPAAISSTTEYQNFWQQLSVLNLIEGSFDGSNTAVNIGKNFPGTKAGKGGIIAYAYTDSINYYHLGLAASTTTTIATSNTLSADDAYNIDKKIDDGFPLTGIVLARGGSALETAATTTTTMGSAAGCIYSTPTPNIYNTSAGTALICQLRIKGVSQ